MSFPLFKDVGKNANDLLKKGYPSTEKYAFRVELDTTSSNGIQFQPYLQETLSKSMEGELKAKGSLKNFTFTGTGNLKEDLSLEITPSNNPKSLKWTLNTSSNMSDFIDRLKGKASVEFRNDYSTTSFTLESLVSGKSAKSEDASKVLMSSVFGSLNKGFALGVDTEYSPTSNEFKSLNTAFSYTKSDIEVSLFSKTKIGGATTLSASYFQRYVHGTDTVQLAGELGCELNKKPSLALGLSFNPSFDSTFKGRFDSKGLLGLSYTEKWKGPLSVTITSDWNVLGAEGNAPFQYGVKLAFK